MHRKCVEICPDIYFPLISISLSEIEQVQEIQNFANRERFYFEDK